MDDEPRNTMPAAGVCQAVKVQVVDADSNVIVVPSERDLLDGVAPIRTDHDRKMRGDAIRRLVAPKESTVWVHRVSGAEVAVLTSSVYEEDPTQVLVTYRSLTYGMHLTRRMEVFIDNFVPKTDDEFESEEPSSRMKIAVHLETTVQEMNEAIERLERAGRLTPTPSPNESMRTWKNRADTSIREEIIRMRREKGTW